MEVVELRKKVEKFGAHVKFNNSSFILGEILERQRSPCDKSGLGYTRKMKSIKLGHGPLGSMKQDLHSQRMEVKLQGMNMYKARKP